MPSPDNKVTLLPPLSDTLDAALLDAILSASDDQIFVLDAQGRFLYVCHTGAAMLGLRRDAMLGQGAPTLGIPPDFHSLLTREQERVLATREAVHGTLQMPTPLGTRELSYTFALLRPHKPAAPAPDAPVVVATFRDMTERNIARRQAARFLAQTQDASERLALKCQELADANRLLEQANAHLGDLAARDGLTGLLNHRALLERLGEEYGRAVRYNLPLALLLLDIDHFKSYNDAFGHPAGDVLLQQVAHILREATRETDTVARYGGEEFFVVLPQTDLPGALAMAERIRGDIERIGASRQSVTVSIGACIRQEDTDSPGALIACADEALYRAKAAGRNQVQQ